MANKTKCNVIIDRLEDDLAVIVMADDDSVKFNLPVTYLPAGTGGGDHLVLTFAPDKPSKDEMRKQIEELLKDS